MGVTLLVTSIELKALKARIEVVPNGLYCCYGDPSYKNDDHNFTIHAVWQAIKKCATSHWWDFKYFPVLPEEMGEAIWRSTRTDGKECVGLYTVWKLQEIKLSKKLEKYV